MVRRVIRGIQKIGKDHGADPQQRVAGGGVDHETVDEEDDLEVEIGTGVVAEVVAEIEGKETGRVIFVDLLL